MIAQKGYCIISGPAPTQKIWGKCVSCEIVGRCSYAVSYLKTLKPNGVKKGCYFKVQLTGEETLYHAICERESTVNKHRWRKGTSR